MNARPLLHCRCQQQSGITEPTSVLCSTIQLSTGLSTALKVDRHIAFFLTTHAVVLHFLKGVQAEEQQGAAGGEEDGSASDEEDEQEGGSNDEGGGRAVALQADIVPESPCPSKHSGVLLSPAPSQSRTKPASPGQASPQSHMLFTSNTFYQQAKSIFHLVS